MIKYLAARALTTLVLSGCMAKMPDGNGTVSASSNDQAIMRVGSEALIGQVTTLFGARASGSSYYRQTQQLEVSNGLLTCKTPLNEKFGGRTSDGFAGNSYNSKVSCSDGTSGAIQITVDRWNGGGFANYGLKGLGIGKLSNGTKLRLTFGPSVTVINTDF